MKKQIIVSFLFILTINLFSQTQEIRKVMYVKSPEGLRIRSEPTITGNRIGTLLFGARVQIYERVNFTTIDGMSDYWYRIDGNSEWVFGGYLSEEFPDNALTFLGLWDNVNDISRYYKFDADHVYSAGKKETSNADWGRWEYNGNIITLITEGFSSEDFEESVISYVQLNIIDKNNIILILSNGSSVKLIRSNDFY